MKVNYKLACALFFYVGSTFSAGPPVTYQFSSGNPIVASEMNSNFQELADRVGTVSTQKKQFVGFTSNVMPADSGIVGFSSQCNSDYLGSKACTTKEFVESVQLSSGNAADVGWVLPYMFAVSNPGGTSSTYLVEVITGEMGRYASNFTCDSWSTTSPNNSGYISGLSVNGLGQFNITPCTDATIKVACCR